MTHAQTLVETGVLNGTVIRDHMCRHLVFGWYSLPAVTAPVSLPESLIARRAGAVDSRRETRCQPGVALSRAPGAAFRRDVHACGFAGTVRDTTVKQSTDLSIRLHLIMSQLLAAPAWHTVQASAAEHEGNTFADPQKDGKDPLK
jgi:hypothetical protein